MRSGGGRCLKPAGDAHYRPTGERPGAHLVEHADHVFKVPNVQVGGDRGQTTRPQRIDQTPPERRKVATIAFAAAARGAKVTGLDLTQRMVDLARERTGASGVPVHFLVGDMSALPFPDGVFDVVTTGYGIRNVPEIPPAVREIARVLRPGGLLLSLDFNRPQNALVRGVYLGT